MKTGMVLMVAMLAAASTAGCASMQKESGYAATPRPQTLHTQDLEYIAAVEHIAQRRGVEVRWVNPPTKRVDVTTRDARQAGR